MPIQKPTRILLQEIDYFSHTFDLILPQKSLGVLFHYDLGAGLLFCSLRNLTIAAEESWAGSFSNMRRKMQQQSTHQKEKPLLCKTRPFCCDTSGLRNQTESYLFQESGSKGGRNLQAKIPVKIQNSAQVFIHISAQPNLYKRL